VPEVKDKQRETPENFYRATHCEVFLPPVDLVGTYANVASVPCEIQVCSMMAHVWNEIEHDLGPAPPFRAPRRRLELADKRGVRPEERAIDPGRGSDRGGTRVSSPVQTYGGSGQGDRRQAAQAGMPDIDPFWVRWGAFLGRLGAKA
jgi:hypothetical protein